MLIQLLHHHLDGFFELRVMALTKSRGLKIDFNVGRDAAVFDFPIAVEAVNSSAWSGDVAAVDQFRIAADTHESAPGLFADQRTDAGLAEVPRQGIAAGTGHFVDDQDLGSVDRFRWA